MLLALDPIQLVLDPIQLFDFDQKTTAQNYSQFRQATKRSSNEYAFNFCKRQKK